MPSARREITLGGPQWVEPAATGKPRKAHGGSNCLLRYAFVGVTTDAFWLPGNAPDEGVVAWHPDDEEHWFWTRVSCLAEAARATAALRRDPEMQPPGGVHIDCFED